MAKIIYRSHLVRRLKERKIPQNYPELIYKKSEQNYVDSESRHRIATAKLKYAEKLRKMVVAYDKIGSNIEIITIFPISEAELKNKIASGRWIRRNKK